MTSTEAMMAPPKPSHPPILTRWDQQLRQAKNRGTRVILQLAVEAFFANADCCVTGYVLETDKNGVKIATSARDVWISKNFIVGTEVLSDAD